LRRNLDIVFLLPCLKCHLSHMLTSCDFARFSHEVKLAAGFLVTG
jgi:hypothetical protein